MHILSNQAIPDFSDSDIAFSTRQPEDTDAREGLTLTFAGHRAIARGCLQQQPLLLLLKAGSAQI